MATNSPSSVEKKQSLRKMFRPKTLAFIAGMFFVVVLLFWVIPSGRALYYQNRAGKVIQQILTEIDEYEAVTTYCAPPELTEEQRVDLEEAWADLEKSLAIRSNYAHTALLLGRANCLLGDADQAVEAYQRYTELRPDNPLGHVELALAYEAENSSLSQVSFAEWKAAYVVENDFFEAAEQTSESKNYELAQNWYDHLLYINPNNAKAWIGIGDIRSDLKEWDKALQAYGSAWQSDPEMASSALANALKDQGDLERMEVILRQALEEYQDSSDRLEWWRILGQSLKDQERWDYATQTYQKAIGEFPNKIDLYISLGWTYYERGDGEQAAISMFKSAIEINTQSGDGYFAIGQLMAREGKYTDADIWFSQAVQLSPNQRWYRLAQANNTRDNGDLTSAIKLYQETIALFPDFANVYYNLAITYRLNDQLVEAVSSIEKAIDLMDPPSEYYYIQAAEIYEHLRDTEKAIRAYNKALSINPNNKIAQLGIERLTGR